MTEEQAATSDEAAAESCREARVEQRAALLLFLVLWATFAYFFHEYPGWNVNSRICLTYAIVENRSFTIDDFQKIPALQTEDIAYNPENGHYYSDKIIGTSLLGTVPMTVLHLASKASGHEFSLNTKRYVVRTFSVSLLGALAGVALFRLLVLFGASVGGAAFLVLAFVFGTQMFSVSTVFLSYAPASCFAIASYGILVRQRDDLRAPILAASGLMLGAGLLCEYTLGIVAIGLTIYTLTHVKRKYMVLYYCLGSAVPLCVFVIYTLICFGEPAIPYKYLVREEFKEGMSRGFQGIVGFSSTVLYYITVHRYRGLFYHSPFLILAAWGWVLMWRDRRWRSDAVLSISMVVAYLVFNASYYMWWGGWTNGPRHLIPALPFLIVPLVWVWRSGPLQRQLLVGLAAVAVFLNTIPALVEAQTPQNEVTRDLYHPAIAEQFRAPGDTIPEIGVKVRYTHREPLGDPLWAGWDNPHKRLCGITGFKRGTLAHNAGRLVGLRGHWSLLPIALLWLAVGIAVGLVMRRTSGRADTSAREKRS